MRKRLLLYGVPWTGLLTALLFSISIGEDAERVGSWLLLGSALVFGLPHGASDFWILKRRVSSSHGVSSGFVALLAIYTLLAALIASIWFFLPDFSILAFLLLTALHFGSGDQIWEESGQRNLISSLLRGLVVIAAPLAFHASGSAAVLKALAPQNQSLVLVDAALALSPAVTLAAAAALLFSDLVKLVNGISFPWIKWLELGLLTAFFWLLTPLYAVSVYFVAVHSWRHVFRLNLYEEKTGDGGFSVPVFHVIADFYRKALPVTAVSLAGLVLIYFVFKADTASLTAWTSSYLILLSALTVPHAILIALTEKKLSAA